MRIVFILLSFLVSIPCHAQITPDSVKIERETEQTVSLSPKKTALLSAVLPGLGQIYNKKYWKVPIIYGGAMGIGYFIQFNHDRYQTFLKAQQAIEQDAPEENPLRNLPNGTNLSRINRGVETLRRNRDLSIIIMAGLYALNIVDALVDVHLGGFNVDEDLSFFVSDYRDSFAKTNITGILGIRYQF